MNLKQFAELAGVKVHRCGAEWGGTWGYTTADRRGVTFNGYRTENSLYRVWASETYGDAAAKALFKLLAKE